MSVLTTSTSFYPGSFQLKLALSSWKPPLVYVRTRFQLAGRRSVNLVPLMVRNSAVNENGVEQRGSGNSSWTNLNSSANDLSGWASTDDDDRRINDPKPKQSLVGIMAAGAAGIVLVAGLTFATLSLSKRSISKHKEQMQPLNAEQEKSLSSDNNQEADEEKIGDNVGVLGNAGGESQIDKNEDLSLSKENGEAIESRISDDTGLEPLSEDGNGSLEAFQRESAIQNNLTSPEAADETPISDISAGSSSLPVGIVDLGNHIKPAPEELVDVKVSETSLFDAKSETLVTVNPNGVHTLSEGELSNLSANHSSAEPSVSDPSPESESQKGLSAKDVEQSKASVDDDKSVDRNILNTTVANSSPTVPEAVYHQSGNGTFEDGYNDLSGGQTLYDSATPESFFTSAGIPAPSVVTVALQSPPGKVLVPAVVDQLQSQALSALQVLKVIEEDVQPGDLCSRREYARWLVSASSALSRNATSKVYPAMYIENASELAFDDITTEDPDFSSIQGLAEAGLIASKLSRRDMYPSVEEDSSPLHFSPESPLSRQDLVSWKMALEKRQLPVVDKKTLQQSSGFIDTEKINPDAWPSIVADLALGEQSIITLAFGYTRLFQPDKPVTKAQAAIALSTGEASTIVSEELARIEAESMAEKAVAAHSALVAQVEKDLNTSYEEQLALEREKINAVEKIAEEARREVEKLRAAREEEKLSLIQQRAAVDSEMELFSKLRQEMEEKLKTLTSDRLEISHEKERLNKLRRDAETENQEIARLQYELEVERKALSMARTWAEDEAKRAKEQARALDEARQHWETQGLKVVVDKNLRDEAEGGATWITAGKEFAVEETIERSETLVDKLRRMADEVRGKSKDTINKIIEKIIVLTSHLKQRAGELKNAAKLRLDSSLQSIGRYTSTAGELKDAAKLRLDSSLQSVGRYTSTAKQVAGEWKEEVEKRLSQRFKT
ncbi:uncharacterized protein LOC127245855 [Andrographis paniculata]|uniref:uncharacterized protein LOC127245855 n=1 Tax=Andrographis paniculata TaxID=175694 RepID=UPI0021E763BB|nr:uncharacterized protein LOC127245855 [Andrographis paniculata]